VIAGTVSADGIPLIVVDVAGQQWSAIIDTGFNGDLELPAVLRGKLNDQPIGRLKSTLAGGQIIEEDAYLVDFPFDDRVVEAVATYVPDSRILIGTNLLVQYYLQIRFASKVVRLDRET
jgi:predicted aspartyl protease